MIKGRIHAGWARVDITPPKKTLLMGQFHARLSKGTVSPLTATALAVEVRGPAGASEHAVFLSCDFVCAAFNAELAKKLSGQCPDLDLDKIVINYTHTHSAPTAEKGIYEEPVDEPDFMGADEFRVWLIARLADAVVAAWNDRRPASVSRGFGYAVVGRCRRAVYADDSALMYGQTNRPDFHGLESCDDHSVNFLFLNDPDGRLSGMIINLACPSQCDEGTEFYSADFWHEVREGLKQRFGENVHLLPQCAPAGDASPHLMLDQKEEKDLRDRMSMNDKQIIAHRILSAVDEAYAFASAPEEEVVFCHEVKTLKLPRIMVTDKERELEKKIPELSEEERRKQPWGFERIWPFGLVCDMVRRYEHQKDNPVHDTECHFIRLGDVVFATNPFELFMDYGARIRARSKALQTFTVQLGDGFGFYLPTARALAGGHYSALIKSNWVGPEGGQMLVDESVATINEMFQDEDYPRTR